ncbi:MAG: HAD-IA family hydrolase [Clostridia bacterium]|nr:HAD-IA family hydrolase [Clostridia bacterium]
MIHAVIFNLEGVLVTTDHCHKQAWRDMARENGIPFDDNTYERMRGLGRAEALNILLSRARRRYTDSERLVLSMRKGDLYMEHISNLDKTCALPGAIETVIALRHSGIRTAVATASQHARFILKHLGIQNLFDAVADGNLIEKPVPHPEVFLLAAEKMHLAPECCLAVDDNGAGIEAAHRAGMQAVGLADAAYEPFTDYRAEDLENIDILALVEKINREQKQ